MSDDSMFKHVGKIAGKMYSSCDKDLLCHYIAKKGANIPLDSPKSCLSITCPECGGSNHFAPIMFLGDVHNRRLWTCANMDCQINNLSNQPKTIPYTPKDIQRPISWESFRDQNAIGDIYQTVRIEDLNQQKHGPERREYCRKFGDNPNEVVIIQGSVGRGKTHLALSICEFFTRKNASCLFYTMTNMMENWYNHENKTQFVSRLKFVRLLVIDDFGTSQPPAGFMTVFMDVINTRNQYVDRGTVITTNLSDKELANFCGDALADRLQTGQKIFVQGDKSERVRKVL